MARLGLGRSARHRQGGVGHNTRPGIPGTKNKSTAEDAETGAEFAEHPFGSALSANLRALRDGTAF